jgi:photosystem II stability/assembly factor-like uncharacterized protein
MQDTQTQDRHGAPDLSGALEWRCSGPHRGGRVVAVAGDPNDPRTFYFGACAGGVWKTVDGGTYWENVSDGFLNTAAIGALAVSPSDPNVIYAGTGESTIRGNVSHGDGVYRSNDGGKTWHNVGLRDTRHISKIRVDPHNPDLVYVAALGHAWGPNPERGVFRSKDGGKTWEQVLHRSDRAGAIDLAMDPSNPRILFATIWEAQRYPYKLVSGGPESGIFRSTDGGDTWTEITRNPGLPKGVLGKIGIVASPAKSGRVWAIIEAEDGAVFRSDDGGDTWRRLCENGDLRRRAWYYMHIFADPKDADTVWVLNLQFWKSTDGGVTFTAMPSAHGDEHDLWIDSNNPQRMIKGDDGGACVTYNGGGSWSTIYNQPTAQFYHVTTDNRFPYRVYGSQQDNSAISVPSMSPLGVIGETEWFVPGGGESGYIAVKPDDPNIMYGGAIGSGPFNGLLTKYDHSLMQQWNVTVWPEDLSMGEGVEALKYRFQWTFPISFSPHDPNVLYCAGNRVFKTTDGGWHWDVISPDLTRADPATLGPSGGPITRDNTGAEAYATIFALVESQHEQGTFWAGSDDGLVHISRDGGTTWEEITPPDLKSPEGEWALISIIEQSPHDAATAYLAATRYKSHDNRPYLFVTNDYGKTWRKITSGIPDDEFTRVIREDPERKGLLYAGTETGVYYSFDAGVTWHRLTGNLPVVPIHDLMVKGDDLLAATHGRAFWVLDDLGPLREAAEGIDSGKPHLFAPPVTTQVQIYPGWGNPPNEYVNYGHAGPVVVGYKTVQKLDGTVEKRYLDAGANPPEGVVVSYYLPEKPACEVTLTFLDAAGNEVRAFKSKKEEPPKEGDSFELEVLRTGGSEGMEADTTPVSDEVKAAEEKEPKVPAEAGANRFVWNMRYPNPTALPGDKSMEDFPPGQRALPGQYTVRLTIGDQSYTQPFELRADPRLNCDTEDLQAQFDLHGKINAKVAEVHEAVIALRDLRDQLDIHERRFSRGEATKNLAAQARTLKRSLTELEGALVNSRTDSPRSFPDKLNFKMASLVFAVMWGDGRPTQQSYEVYEKLAGEIDAQLARYQALVSGEVKAFNEAVTAAGMPVLAPSRGAAAL